MNNIINTFLFLVMTGLVQQVKGQHFAPFIQMMWDHHHQLKGREFALNQAQDAWSEAKAMYRPTVTFGTQYTLATGGRSIDFPIGDLLNPVHDQLNELTASQRFPTLANQNILFLPNNFYDARFRVQQPIFYPDLAINRTAKSKQQDLRLLEIKAHKRLLVRDFMNAYFQWKQASEVVKLYEINSDLLIEARRTTQSMIRNGVALPSASSRIEGELATMEANKLEAAASEENAWTYLVFLLGANRLTRDQVDLELLELPEPDLHWDLGDREELQQMDVGLQLHQLAMQKEDLFHKPRLAAQLDLGSQDFNFGIEPYALLGINLEWNIFDGKRHQLRRQQVTTGLRVLEEERIYAELQMNLQVDLAKRTLEAGLSQALTFRPRIQAAEKNYWDVLKKYESGSANYLELLDAFTQVTQTQINYLLTRYLAWGRWAEYVYTGALYPID